MADLVAERAALNQRRFRELNEQIEPGNRMTYWVDPPMPDWVCECASETCSVPVRLSLLEYEAIRADSTRFLVSSSDEHVVPEVERVVERNERYWIVEKFGEAAAVVESLDARAHEVASKQDELVLRANAIAWNLPSAKVPQTVTQDASAEPAAQARG